MKCRRVEKHLPLLASGVQKINTDDLLRKAFISRYCLFLQFARFFFTLPEWKTHHLILKHTVLIGCMRVTWTDFRSLVHVVCSSSCSLFTGGKGLIDWGGWTRRSSWGIDTTCFAFMPMNVQMYGGGDYIRRGMHNKSHRRKKTKPIARRRK